MATIGVEDVKKMKVNDLKKELKDRGLPVSGTKDVLAERLQAALSGAPVPAEDSTEVPAVDVDSVEKSIDQLVGDTTPAQPAESAPVVAAAAVTATSKENIPKSDTVSDEEPAKKVVSLKGMSEAERMKARAAKFGGAVSESAKKQMRAERFGIQSSSTGSTDKIGAKTASTGDIDKLKKRAERFGMVVSNTLSQVDDDEKKKKRLERFGNVTSSSPTEAKKVKLSSSSNDVEEKKKQRAARFGLT